MTDGLVGVGDVLAGACLFQDLPREALERIATLMREELYSAGTEIIAHGEPGDALYVLARGRVRIVRILEGVGEETLAMIRPGDVFGELSVVDGLPRSASAVAHEACTVLSLSRDAWLSLIAHDSDVAAPLLRACLQLLAARLRQTTDKLMFLSTAGRF